MEQICSTEKQAQEAGVKHPPKVRDHSQLFDAAADARASQIVFKDQHGHKVSHNPETLEHVRDWDLD